MTEKRISLEGEQLSYRVRESKRASRGRVNVGLGGVEVVVPTGSGMQPEELLREKKDWVLKKERMFQKRRKKLPDRQFEEGACFPFKGELHE
jgi:predicted metal-dependent hydrolase